MTFVVTSSNGKERERGGIYRVGFEEPLTLRREVIGAGGGLGLGQ